jgi:4-hydroxyphenylacetate 3-monooxygenase
LLKILAERLDDFDDSSDFVCFAGTLPLIDGTFVPGTQWELELTLPDGRSLRHSYTTKEL